MRTAVDDFLDGGQMVWEGIGAGATGFGSDC